MASYESNKAEVLKSIEQAKNRALESIGLFVEGDAKLRCPVDTGNLRGSLTHEVKSDHVVVGTNVEYSAMVEKGTSNQKSQPYLTPAAENNIGKIEELARREMSKI